MPMKALALAAIRCYQRFISPYKGFSCPYHRYTGRASCSDLGYRAIRRFGVWDGLGVLRQRLDCCGSVYRDHAPPPAVLHDQAGFCDLSCDGCDFPTCDFLPDSDCSDLPCDCGDWGSLDKRQERKAKRQIHRQERKAKRHASFR
ncbi:hypothetical protein BAC2_02356 [uncultured bacterium]|nr:hypothetical protein BAC2_02356 [uncultured bacterium]